MKKRSRKQLEIEIKDRNDKIRCLAESIKMLQRAARRNRKELIELNRERDELIQERFRKL